MNTFKKTLSLMLLSSGLAVSAQVLAHDETTSNDIRFVGDTQFAGFCQAIVKDDVTQLRQQAARNVGRLAGSQRGVIRAVAAENGVTCNGKTLIEFSQDKQANDVRAYLIAQS